MPPPRLPFRIKICGVRRVEDVEATHQAGGDAIGLNFFPPSIRYLDPDGETAQRVATAGHRAGLQTVGVFVDEASERIAEVAAQLQLDAIQLHGNESLADATPLLAAGWRVIRAIRLPAGPLTADEIDRRVLPWSAVGAAILIDADAGPAFGGSGSRLDWHSLGRWSKHNSTKGHEWALAGGLSPHVVGQAIAVSQPTAVDVASGTESPRGVKSPERIAQFCAAARAGWPQEG